MNTMSTTTTTTATTTHDELSDLRDEQRDLALLTVDLDCSQQKFFQGEYGRHRRSPTVALLLCVLLGNFGAHEFYFGRVLSGLVRLLFSWTLVPWLIALVEAPRVPAYARQYNADLARSIVDMLHEIRGRMLTLDGGASSRPARAAVAAPVTAAPPALSALSAKAAATQSGSVFGRAAIGAVALAPIVTLSAEAAALASAHHETPDCAPANESDGADEAEKAGERDIPVTGPAERERDREPVFAYTMAPTRHPPVRYGPPLTEETIPVASVVPAAPVRRHIRRIVVRKVATVDGEVVGEAIAMREVSLDGDTDTLAQRIEQATEDARQEALRLLASRVSPEALAEADNTPDAQN